MALILIPDNVRGMLEYSHATVSLFTLWILYIILQYLLLLWSPVYKYYYSTYYVLPHISTSSGLVETSQPDWIGQPREAMIFRGRGV